MIRHGRRVTTSCAWRPRLMHSVGTTRVGPSSITVNDQAQCASTRRIKSKCLGSVRLMAAQDSQRYWSHQQQLQLLHRRSYSQSLLRNNESNTNNVDSPSLVDELIEKRNQLSKELESNTSNATGKADTDWAAFVEEQRKSSDPYYLPGTQKDIFDPQIHMASAPSDWSEYEPGTMLWEEFYAGIGVTGKPMSVAEYMRLCLTHPQYGYYTVGTSAVKDEFDKEEWDDDFDDAGSDSVIGGDFITAPEISQLFGETLGVWFATQLQQQGLLQKSWQYVEAGPGKGSLLVDLMRFWSLLAQTSGGKSGNMAPDKVHLLETSPKMREVQQQALERDMGDKFHLVFEGSSSTTDDATTNGDKVDEKSEGKTADKKPTVTIHWHDSMNTFQLWQEKENSHLPTFAVSQEFIDALPIYAFEKTSEGWRERMIDIALRDDLQKEEMEELGINSSAVDSGTYQIKPGQKKLRLRCVTAPELTTPVQVLLGVDENGLIPNEVESGQEAEIGTVIEVNPEGNLFARDLAQVIGQQGGGALIIDYGQEGSHDSIRAFSDNEQVHFLSRPGLVDVTADVDFGALKQAVNQSRLGNNASGACAFGPTYQGAFLMAMGIKERAIQLSERPETSEEDSENLYNALVRLCSPSEMGERFKVLTIVPGDESTEPPPGF